PAAARSRPPAEARRALVPTWTTEAGLITIGLPVRNGMPHLAEALSSLQAQTYPNLAIHVSDNASDDGPEAYCRSVAAADPRVVYRRLDANIGAARNFNEVFPRGHRAELPWAARGEP